jgi:hypothetical protein
MRLVLLVFPILLFAGCRSDPCLAPPQPVGPEEAATDASPWRDLLAAPGTSWIETSFGGEGEVTIDDDGLVLGFGSPLTGVHWIGAALPTTDYELEVTAARLEGSDFFCGLTFPVNESHLTLILGGWGGSLTGLSSLNGMDAFENGTASYVNYETGRPYTARVRVEGARVRTWLGVVDGEPLHDIDTSRRVPSLRVEVLASRPLGITAYSTRARIHRLLFRRIP